MSINQICRLAIVALALSACTSTPNLEKISAHYVSCDSKSLKPMEVTNYGWYQGWYVDCEGREYFCRYSPQNQNDLNGCRLNWDPKVGLR